MEIADSTKTAISFQTKPSRTQSLHGLIFLLQKKGITSFLLHLLSSFLLLVVEYAISLFLIIFLFSLGLASLEKIPSWIPQKLLTLSSSKVWWLIFSIGTLRLLSSFLYLQSAHVLFEHARKRFQELLSIQLIMGKEKPRTTLSEINQNLSELFPKAADYLHYVLLVSSSSIRLAFLGLGMAFVALPEALAGSACLSLTAVAITYSQRSLNRAAERSTEHSARLHENLLRAVKNWLVVRVLNLQKEEHQHIQSTLGAYVSQMEKTHFYRNISSVLPPFLGVLSIALISFVHLRFSTTPSVHLVGFLYLFLRFVDAASMLVIHVGYVNNYRTQFEKVFSLLDLENRAGSKETLSRENEGTLFEKSPPPSITISSVFYRWRGETKDLLQDINVHLEGGLQLGITGLNGSGKSTLLQLILGVLHADSGKVLINSLPNSQYMKENHRDIAYVCADPHLIAGSIRENLTYGLKNEVEEEELFRVLEKVALENFVRSLPKGIHQPLNEEADILSLGQKQKLALARALLRHPSLLIMDEAASNLDKDTVSEIVNIIKSLKGKCSVIIVSHKPELLTHADQTIHLKRAFA